MTDPRTGLSPEAADDELLQQLAQALRPPPLTPSPASLEALRQAVEQKWRPTGRGRVMEQLTAWARRLQRSGAALAILGGVVVGGTGVALAANRSIPQPVQYTLHDLGIPALSWAADHYGHLGPAHPSVKARPDAARSTRLERAPLAGSTASFQILLAPAGGSRTPRRVSSAPARSTATPSVAGSRPSTPTTDPAVAPGPCDGWASPPVAGTAAPAPRGSTTPRSTTPAPPTAWSQPRPTGPWRTDPGWSQPGTGGFTGTNGAPPTMGVNSGSPPDQATPYATNSYETSPYEASPYEASRQSDATYAPTNSGGHPAYGGGWYGP